MVKSLFEIQPWVCFLPPVETDDSELAHKLPLNTEMKPILFSLNYQNRSEKSQWQLVGWINVFSWWYWLVIICCIVLRQRHLDLVKAMNLTDCLCFLCGSVFRLWVSSSSASTSLSFTSSSSSSLSSSSLSSSLSSSFSILTKCWQHLCWQGDLETAPAQCIYK